MIPGFAKFSKSPQGQPTFQLVEAYTRLHGLSCTKPVAIEVRVTLRCGMGGAFRVNMCALACNCDRA